MVVLLSVGLSVRAVLTFTAQVFQRRAERVTSGFATWLGKWLHCDRINALEYAKEEIKPLLI